MGSSFAIGKVGLQYFSPFFLVAMRFILAGLVMAAMVRQYPHPKQLKPWLQIGLIGVFQTAGVMGFIFLSLQTISAGESSILTFINPLLVVILARVILGTHYKGRQWLGVVVGILGVAVTLGGTLSFHRGTIYGLLGAFSWAIATILVKKWGGALNIWVLTAYQMLAGGLVLLVASLVLEPIRASFTVNSIMIVVWLAIMASVVQFGIWFYLLQHGDPGRTSAFLFLAPFFGVLSGWVILNEPIHLTVLFGGILIAIGIVLVNYQPGGPAITTAEGDP